jgi:nitrogenase-stabilizing/protective protein
MTLAEELSRLSSAEEFFRFLQVDFDPAVLNVARLHILQRMGQAISGTSLLALDEVAGRALCRSSLQAAYDEFAVRSPLEQRLFKVHRRAALVPLGARSSR